GRRRSPGVGLTSFDVVFSGTEGWRVRTLRRADERVLRAVTSSGGAVLDEVMPRASRVADQLVV
ncbi:MAG: hypothetical protein ACJ72W_01710, partial [Actinoallomurus sp.]